jgi:signal transduction histidine kinase/DNA-binding CsgD family transcriptional regulator
VHLRLEQAATPERALPDVLATTLVSLRLDHLSVVTADGEALATAGGPPPPGVRRLPLVHAGTTVGDLVVGGGRRRRRDEDVLAELAGALAPVVQAARLHDDLVRSRERLVVAREEERRRLRRDLHDGLGPTLAGLTLKLDTARNLLGDAPLLREMRDDVQATVADVRRLVEGLRPVSLDELGLAEALRRLVDRTPPDGPQVQLVTDDADSPAAAVEVAAYRIVQEALTNVLRHSGARSCDVTVRGRNGSLVVSVADDGRGAAGTGGRGSGLETMRERAEELGGSLVLLPRAGASGFLLKDAQPEELLAAIRAVAAGDAVVAPRATRRLLDHVAGARPAPSEPDPRLASLTDREREVLLAVSRGASNAEVGAELHMAEATVKTHVGRLLTKLGARDRVQLVVFAYEHGLVRA